MEYLTRRHVILSKINKRVWDKNARRPGRAVGHLGQCAACGAQENEAHPQVYRVQMCTSESDVNGLRREGET